MTIGAIVNSEFTGKLEWAVPRKHKKSLHVYTQDIIEILPPG